MKRRGTPYGSAELETKTMGLGTRPTEFAERDELARFDRLLFALRPELRRFVARRVRPDAVDDVLGEILLAAWRALRSFEGRSTLCTFLYSVALRKCCDHYRAQKAQACLEPLDDRLLVDSRPSAEEIAVRSDIVDRLLASLDEEHRAVLEMVYGSGLTLAETSLALGRNLSTVKYQFYRAHAALLAKGEREGLR